MLLGRSRTIGVSSMERGGWGVSFRRIGPVSAETML